MFNDNSDIGEGEDRPTGDLIRVNVATEGDSRWDHKL